MNARLPVRPYGQMPLPLVTAAYGRALQLNQVRLEGVSRKTVLAELTELLIDPQYPELRANAHDRVLSEGLVYATTDGYAIPTSVRDLLRKVVHIVPLPYREASRKEDAYLALLLWKKSGVPMSKDAENLVRDRGLFNGERLTDRGLDVILDYQKEVDASERGLVGRVWVEWPFEAKMGPRELRETFSKILGRLSWNRYEAIELLRPLMTTLEGCRALRRMVRADFSPAEATWRDLHEQLSAVGAGGRPSGSDPLYAMTVHGWLESQGVADVPDYDSPGFLADRFAGIG